MNKNKKLGLLFLGRLEAEKGFDLIFDFIKQYPNKELPFELYIFGSGSYEMRIMELSKRFKEIHFFGWKPLSEVERYLENIDYCLMPSKCLETFGLSAINVLKRGIPVVGYKKGGLSSFIPDKYDLSQCEGSTDFLKMKTMLLRLQQEREENNTTYYQSLAQKNKKIVAYYTKEKWLQNFQKLIGPNKGKKIVLVSDFITKIGGIETYLHDVKILLKKQGYEVKLFGSNCPQGKRGKLKKVFGIALSSFNLFEAIRFYFFIQKESPDLIWYNSMLRRNGWLPLRFTRRSTAIKWMMYHDFGYFTPYPHQLRDVREIKAPLSLKNYLAMANTQNPFKQLLIMGKYFSLTFLKKQLKKQIDLHLLPSAFMLPIAQKSFKLPNKKVKTFNHFLQE